MDLDLHAGRVGIVIITLGFGCVWFGILVARDVIADAGAPRLMRKTYAMHVGKIAVAALLFGVWAAVLMHFAGQTLLERIAAPPQPISTVELRRRAPTAQITRAQIPADVPPALPRPRQRETAVATSGAQIRASNTAAGNTF